MVSVVWGHGKRAGKDAGSGEAPVVERRNRAREIAITEIESALTLKKPEQFGGITKQTQKSRGF